jgi:hypothetical protein
MAQRELSEEDYNLFRFHHLLGAPWRLCCLKLKMEKGEFFHQVYRIEQRLGRAFRETEPYGLFPLDEYFGGATMDAVKPLTPPREGPKPLQPPMDRKKSEPIAA